jgi:hypothetical protein
MQLPHTPRLPRVADGIEWKPRDRRQMHCFDRLAAQAAACQARGIIGKKGAIAVELELGAKQRL